MKIKITLLILTFFYFGSSNASLIDNGNFTTDTTTNLDWLDITFSKGYSYNELIIETATGGLFDGFHLATIDQVNSLFVSAGLPSIGNFTTDFGSVNNLIDLIGSTSEQDGYLQSIGITATSGDPFSHQVTGLDFLFSNGQPIYSLIDGLTYGNSFGTETVGGWLIRESIAVPEPSSLAMLGFGMLLLLGRVKIRPKVKPK